MTLPPFLAKYGIYLGLALLVAVVLGLTYCEGHKAGKSGEVVKEQGRTIQVEQKVGQANENAAGRRVTDATKAVQQEKDLKDALHATDNPDRQRTLRGCLILRQQGRDTAKIPACRGPSAGG